MGRRAAELLLVLQTYSPRRARRATLCLRSSLMFIFFVWLSLISGISAYLISIEVLCVFYDFHWFQGSVPWAAFYMYEKPLRHYSPWRVCRDALCLRFSLMFRDIGCRSQDAKCDAESCLDSWAFRSLKCTSEATAEKYCLFEEEYARKNSIPAALVSYYTRLVTYIFDGREGEHLFLNNTSETLVVYFGG